MWRLWEIRNGVTQLAVSPVNANHNVTGTKPTTPTTVSSASPNFTHVQFTIYMAK